MDFVRRGLSLVASASKHRVSAGAALGVTPAHQRYVSNIVFNPAYSNKHIASLVCLHSLSDNPGARKKARRVGRGPGSSKGKTCGRGHKGQKSRSGATGHHDRTFEGGQTPLYKRMRKYGFTNPSKVDYDWINLDKLQYLIDKGRVDPSKPITMKSLFDARHFTKVPQGLKLLAGKHPEVFTAKVHLEVTAASEGAARQIEELGGTVKRVFYSPEALRALLKPEKFPLYKPHRGLPHPKKAHRFDDWGQDAAASDSTSPATASP